MPKTTTDPVANLERKVADLTMSLAALSELVRRYHPASFVWRCPACDTYQLTHSGQECIRCKKETAPKYRARLRRR